MALALRATGSKNSVLLVLRTQIGGSIKTLFAKSNQYFNLASCNDNLDIKCKVLEWLSRGAYKTEPYGTKKKNVEFNNFMLNGINQFLDTEFTREEMGTIYQELGNEVNRTLCIEFVNSGFDMNVLRSDSQQTTTM